MSRVLGWALLADGPTDRVLLDVGSWLLRQRADGTEFAEPGFRVRGGTDLSTAMRSVVDELRPDILLVHRDAERVDAARRRSEIPSSPGRVVRVVPVRMTEAWLLFDERAIRAASGNPNGGSALSLPSLPDLELRSNPKRDLADALLAAADPRTRRKRNTFLRDSAERVLQTARCIEDFSPLRALSAFRVFESDLHSAVADWFGTTAEA